MTRVRHDRGRHVLRLGLVLPLLLAACTVGPSERPAVLEHDGPPPTEGKAPDEPPPLPPLGEPGHDAVGWNSCDKETRAELDGDTAAKSIKFSCAVITGTLDPPQLPDRGTIRLAVLKAESGSGGEGDDDGEAGKMPLVVVNDIDGEPGTRFAARLATRLPESLLGRFDIIGIDRRGTGASQPTKCIPPDIRLQLAGFDQAAEDLDPLVDAARSAGQECALALKNEQGALDSWHTAGDLNVLRGQLGVPRLHAIAVGDGSRVLTAFGHRFKDRVGRVALDGVPDPSTEAPTVLEGIAAGAEATLDAFAADCVTRSCPLGDKPREAVTSLLNDLRTSNPRIAGGVVVTPALALNAIWAGLARPERWPALAEAIDRAAKGKPDTLAKFAAPMYDSVGDDPPRIDATLATRCNDTTTRLSPDRIGQFAAEWRQKHPVFGGLLAQQLVWCGQWPVRREPLPEPDVPGIPPVVVVSTADDPMTPGLGTLRSKQQMSSAVRIGWEGAGHGAIGRSECVDDKINAFLVDGKIPSDGATCPA